MNPIINEESIKDIQISIKKACSNYEEFHKLSEGSASLSDIRESSLGITGWGKSNINRRKMDEYVQSLDKKH